MEEERTLNFKGIPPVLSSEKIIDKAFSRASKASKSLKIKGDPSKKARAREKHRANIAYQIIDSYLLKIVKSFPDLSSLPQFYVELINLLIDVQRLKKALASLSWAKKTIKKLLKTKVRDINKAKTPKEAAKARRHIYGRIASILQRINPNLKFLEEARLKMKQMPCIQESPTIVIAGYPNVGKSTFVSNVSTAKPKIDVYPFTTKEIHVGYLNFDNQRIQIIDTPGILDRPISKRNRIEKQAILALKFLADLIIFLLDPSETCGYPLKDQLSLLDEVKNMFSNQPLVVVLNKVDAVPNRDIVENLMKSLRADELVATNAEKTRSLLKKYINMFKKELGLNR